MGYSVFQAGHHGIVESPAWPVREAMIGDFDIATISGHSLAGVEQILDVYFERARAAKKNGK